MFVGCIRNLGYEKRKMEIEYLTEIVSLKEDVHSEMQILGKFIGVNLNRVDPFSNPNETIYNREDIRRSPRRD